MIRAQRLLIAAVVVPVTAGALSSCAGLEFRADRRLSITAPKKHAVVTAPVTVSWTMTDPPPGGSYAVFVDRNPIKVGQTLKAVVESNDNACKSDPACPDPAYLQAHYVYRTTAPTVQIQAFKKLTSNRTHVEHEVTVVLLDATGTRANESSWSRDFEVHTAQVGS